MMDQSCCTISSEDFYNNRNSIDKEKYASFEKQFKRLVYQFKSLSTSLTNYKKIPKVNFINTPKSETTILNLLNKITSDNYDRILQKILLKTNQDNAVLFVNQVLRYTEKSGKDNANVMWFLIHSILEDSISQCFDNENGMVCQQIIDNIESFVTNFIDHFGVICDDSKDIDKEHYSEFLQRNIDNTAVVSKAHLIYVMLSDTNKSLLSPKYTIEYVIQMLTTKLKHTISQCNSSYDNILNMNLECLRILMAYVKKDINYQGMFKDFLTTFDNTETKSGMSNKNKFKLMDIIDLIKIDNKQ